MDVISTIFKHDTCSLQMVQSSVFVNEFKWNLCNFDDGEAGEQQKIVATIQNS
jgi:hypothetical protein